MPRLEQAKKAPVILVMPSGKITVESAVPANAPSILVTVSGITTLVRLEHSIKVLTSVVIPEPITALVKLVQSWHTAGPRFVTVLGIVRVVNFRQPKNAFVLRVVTVGGIIKLLKAVLKKGPSPMVVTLEGIVTLVTLVSSANA